MFLPRPDALSIIGIEKKNLADLAWNYVHKEIWGINYLTRKLIWTVWHKICLSRGS